MNSVNLGNVTWVKGTTIKINTSSILRGNSFFNPMTGTLRPAPEDGEYTWITRRISAEAFSLLKWQDGTKLTAQDYVNWSQQNSDLIRPIIESVSAPTSGALVINYTLGVTKDLADRIVPLPLSPRNIADLLNDSTTDWQINRITSDSFAVTHVKDFRKSFNLNMLDEKVFTSLTPNSLNADVVIIDAIIAPKFLSAIAGSELKEYNIFLVPTGSILANDE